MNKHIVKHIVNITRWLRIWVSRPCGFVGLMPLGALHPSKSGLMNKHIVKHSPSQSGLMNKHIVKHISLSHHHSLKHPTKAPDDDLTSNIPGSGYCSTQGGPRSGMKIVMWNAADFKTVGDHVGNKELTQAKTPKEINALARLVPVLPRLPMGATRDKLDVGKLATQLNHMVEEKRSRLNCDYPVELYPVQQGHERPRRSRCKDFREAWQWRRAAS